MTLEQIRSELPLPLLGLDVDNDTAFINSTLVGYCTEHGIELTRSRAYKKNDQAWIAQKNGSVVRKMVGYGRLEGMRAVAELAELHRAARLRELLPALVQTAKQDPEGCAAQPAIR